jgi:predicted enzyme related to lactoylglutathione lyase
VGLSQVEKPKVEGGPTLTWGVKDIEAARAELEGKGVKFDGETRVIPEMVKLATFFDPDGNHLMFYQSLAQG